MKLKNIIISITALAVIGILLFIIKSGGQSIVYEKTLGSPYAEFRPNAIAVDSKDNIYITGRCETNLAYFKKVGDTYKYADTTIPQGTHIYLYKINGNGKLIKRKFFGALEGMGMCVTREGNIAVTGFVSEYRQKNYEGDLTQGVYTALLTPDLDVIWQEITPSQYNSVPERMIETSEGNLLVLAHSIIKKVEVSAYLVQEDTHDRFILLNKDGKTLKDTTYEMVDIDYGKEDFFHIDHPYDPKAKLRAPANLLYDVQETEKGFLFAGTGMGTNLGVQIGNCFFIMETDKQFNLKKVKSFEFRRDTEKNRDINWGYSIAPQGDKILFAGIAQYSGKRNVVACLNKNFDTIYTRHFNGDIFSQPKVIALHNGNYCVCNYTDSNRINLNFMNESGFTKKLEFKNKTIVDFNSSMCLMNDYLYITAVAKDSGVACTYLAKVKL